MREYDESVCIERRHFLIKFKKGAFQYRLIGRLVVLPHAQYDFTPYLRGKYLSSLFRIRTKFVMPIDPEQNPNLKIHKNFMGFMVVSIKWKLWTLSYFNTFFMDLMVFSPLICGEKTIH